MTDAFVEALEEGKIVRVSREYALREGLIVVKKKHNDLGFSAYPEEAQALGQSRNVEAQKPYYLKNDVLAGLKENFNWELQKQRKLRNLTRRQLANLSSVSEQDIITLERGQIPQNLIALSKLETFYNISLRK